MKNQENKTNAELIKEIEVLQEKVNDLEKSEKQFRLIAESTSDVITLNTFDLKASYTYLSPSVEALIGYKPEELLGKSSFDLIHPEDKKVLFPLLKKYIGYKLKNLITRKKIDYSETIELRIKNKMGKWVYVHSTANTMGDQLLFVTRDITKSKKVQEALRKSKEKYHGLFDESIAVVYLFDTEKNFIDSNQAGLELLGYSRDELLKMSIPDVDADPVVVLPAHQNLLTGGRLINYEHKLKRKDGTIITVLNNSRALTDTEGNVIGLQSTLVDITERKQAEEKLLKTRERLELAMNAGEHGFWDWNLDTNDIYFSPRYYTMLGYKTDELPMKLETWVDLMHPDDRKTIVAEVENYVKNAQAYEVEFRLKTKGGDWKWISGRGKSYKKDKNGFPHRAVGVHVDITERKRAEQTQSVLYNITDAVNATKSIDELFKIIHKQLSTIIDTTNYFVALYDKETDIISLPYHTDTKDKIISFPAGKTLTSYVIKTGKSLLVDKEVDEKLTKAGKIETIGTPSKIWLGAPLKIENKVIGVVVVQSYTDASLYTEKDLAILEFVSDAIAITIKHQQDDEAITENEEKFRSVVENSHEGIFIVDKDYRFIYVNDELCQILGYPDEEIIGQDFRKFIDEDSKKFVSDRYIRRQRGEDIPSRYEFNVMQKDGKKRQVEISSSVIKNSKGEIFTVAQILDITERKRAEQIQHVILNISNKSQLSLSVEETTQIIKKELGRLMDTKNFFIALYNEENDNITLPYFSDEKDDIDEFPAGKTLTGLVIKQGQSMLIDDAEAKKLTKEGKIDAVGYDSKIWLGVPLKIKGKVIGAFVVQSYTDSNAYTEKDKDVLEIISHQISVSIEKKLNEERLLEALEKATESDRLKSAFLSTISHELRTPLNAIIGFSEIINEDIPLEDILDFVKMINKSGHNLFEIIEDILDVTDIESEKSEINKTEFHISSIFDEIVEDIESTQEKENKNYLEIKLNIPADAKDLKIVSNESKIKKALIHLLRNAIKFTEKGYIEYGFKPEKNKIVFYVKDTGVGIPKNKRDIIFDKFRQADDSHTRKFGGMGIGLTLVKKLIELLDGEIWFDSVEGKGTTMYFSIPIIVKETEEKTIIKEIRKDLTGKTILVAEDEESNYMLLEKILKLENINIIRAVNGKEAVKKFKEIKEIGLILMDIKMPVMNGYEATVEIRKISNIPILALSAYTDNNEKEEAYNCGCNDFIEKPIKRTKLLKKIAVFLDV